MSHLINVALASVARDPIVAALLIAALAFAVASVVITVLHFLRVVIGLVFVPSESTRPADDPKEAA